MARVERGNCATGARRVPILAGARLLAGLIAGSALSFLAGPVAAQTAQQVQDAAGAAIRRLDLQTDFPRGPEPWTWHGHVNLPPETLWVVIAIAIGVLLYALRDLIPAWRSAGHGAWAPDEGTLGAATPGDQGVILEAADELAAAGRFMEAMHMLLLQGLAHMRQRLDEQFSDSLTSREILHRASLPETARASLRDVVTRVELTYFGKHPAALADYIACRESFNALARSLYGGAPA
jgi:hypothetical protein